MLASSSLKGSMLPAELSQYKAQGGCLVPNQGSEECFCGF